MKIKNIKLSKNQLIIIISSLVVLITAIILLFVFLNKKEDKKIVDIVKEVVGLEYKDGYAVDTKEAIETSIYQTYEDSDITYKMYGEVGWRNFNCMKESDKSLVSVSQKRDDQYSSENYAKLSNEPYIVKNHYIVSLTGAMDSKGSYHMDGAVDDIGTFYLTAYAELPDGTLISISSKDTPYFQINIYENETRIVMDEDFGTAMYFRVPDLNGRILTVQIGNKLIKTSGNSEFFVYSERWYFLSSSNKKLANDFLESVNANDEIINDVKNSNTICSYSLLGGVIPISGDVSVLTRGTTKEEKISNEYRFISYRKNYKNILENYSYEYVSIGKEFTKNDTSEYTEEYYGFLKDQKNLNKTSYGFNKVVTKGTNISTMIKKYIEDFTEYSLNIIRDYNSQRASNSICGNDFLDILENCGCKDGWYHIKGVGCCPNGYTYSTSQNKCIATIVTTTRSCPTGTHYVGNDKCCKDGTALSSDGLSCTSSSGKTEVPTYYPNSNSTSGATAKTTTTTTTDSGCKPSPQCFSMDDSLAKVGCPNGVANHTWYVKNGQCCFDLVCVE